jgi:hypothetical protein
MSKKLFETKLEISFKFYSDKMNEKSSANVIGFGRGSETQKQTRARRLGHAALCQVTARAPASGEFLVFLKLNETDHLQMNFSLKLFPFKSFIFNAIKLPEEKQKQIRKLTGISSAAE